MKNDFLVIPADGSMPFFIPQFGSINDTWHNLMRDPDRDLCFETVVMDAPFDDLIMLVDDAAKLRPHSLNEFASDFYVGSAYGDYIAGTAMCCRIGLVPFTCDDGEVIMEHDLFPLLPCHLDYFQRLIDLYRAREDYISSFDDPMFE